MTVLDIVRAYLREHRLDGLCNARGGCACCEADLAPCSALAAECVAGRFAPCPEECGEHDWHITPDAGCERPERPAEAVNDRP